MAFIWMLHAFKFYGMSTFIFIAFLCQLKQPLTWLLSLFFIQLLVNDSAGSVPIIYGPIIMDIWSVQLTSFLVCLSMFSHFRCLSKSNSFLFISSSTQNCLTT